jgi:DNA-binding transcriptional LysR family regulator
MDRLLSMRVFQRVADEGGFAAAARALELSPAAVTRLVADLEDHLQTRLLQRSTRRLSLTEAGQSYLVRVRSILEEIDQADAVASAQSSELAGMLRIHTPPVLATYIIAPLLAPFRARYPDIRLEIEVDAPAEPPVEDFDVTLVGTSDGLPADVVVRKIVESEAILVASPRYLAQHGWPAQLEDLARHHVLRTKKPGQRSSTWRMWSEDQPDDPVEVDITPTLIANHTDTLLRAALDGAGITSIAMDLAAAPLTRGELVRVLPPWTTGRLALYAALPSRKFTPRRTRVFLDFLVEHTRRISGTALESCVGCAGAPQLVTELPVQLAA